MNSIHPAPSGQVDLTNCDREPIHLLGGIQDVGLLLAVSTDWLIERVSTNLQRFVDRDPETLPGEPITSLLPPESLHAIRGRLQLLASNDATERLFAFDLFGEGRRFDVAVHLSGASIIIEAEPTGESQSTNPGTLVRSMIARIQRTVGLESLYKEAVRQLRAVSGFDRVMLYRFSADGSGMVIAESVVSGVGSFHGLSYPATDIPAQARALYVRNLTRLIADVKATPVPILPALDPHGQAIDLSLSGLRSVSPIHIEYLRNMGVGASMSVSIVIEGRLWGLFALHHYAPRHLAMELRSAIELFAEMIAFVIEGRLFQEQRSAEQAARELHDRFLSRMVAASPSLESIAQFSEELREIIPCDGIAIVAKGETEIIGICPTPEELRPLTRFLNRAGASRVYATDDLAGVHPPAADYLARAAGLLAIPISRSPRDYIVFFRREILQTVTWAGDPTGKEQAPGPNGPRLTPRKSFEAWKETVYGRSNPWTPAELKAAESLRVSILEVLLRFNEESERQQTAAKQRQELLIAELNHRVRNILGLIRALIVQSKPGARDLDEFAEIIGGRIQALARAHDQITAENFSNVLLEDIVRTEIAAYIGGRAALCQMSGPPVFVEASAFSTLALVFHELVTNSAKYGALSDSTGSVRVEWTFNEDEGCTIRWRESGGPPVAAPKRRGFGSTIIERSIPHELGGEARIDYRIGGVQAQFVLPPAIVRLQTANEKRQEDSRAVAETAKPPARQKSLEGLSALIVEDNMIIALDAEQLMIDHGMRRVKTVASVAEARRVIEAEPIDIALLDVNLGHETSFGLVEGLNAKGVPYVFVTGYGETVDLPPEAAGAKAIKKPFADDILLAALGEALAQGAARSSPDL